MSIATKGLSIVAVAVLLAACDSSSSSENDSSTPTRTPSTELPRSPVLSLEFWQADKPAPLRTELGDDKEIVETKISAAPFEVRFPKRSGDVPVRLCAWTDQSIFVLEPAQPVSAVPFFVPGTGAADEPSGQMTMFVSNESHNHMAEGRVASHSSDQDQVQFKSISLDGEFATGDVFVAVFMDHDTDEVIDTGEFEYLRIQVA